MNTREQVSPAILCRAVRKSYGQTVALQSLDLEVERGECFGLLGPNGAGKTTLVEILVGLSEADQGSVRVLGLDWKEDREALRSKIGVQLQHSSLPDRLTVTEVIHLFRSFYPDPRPVEELLGLVQLEEKRNTQVRQLSGGQKQRLTLVSALAGSPELLVLDEPTVGLDPQSRQQLWRIVERFRDEGGTVLLTTHFMDEAEVLCDRVAILDQGAIVDVGTPRQLMGSIGGGHIVEFACSNRISEEALRGLPTVSELRVNGQTHLLTVEEPSKLLPALLEAISRGGGELTELRTQHATLEDVFLARTGHILREN